MLRRSIIEKFLQWKNRKSKECLLVKGARQIGKTYIIREFGKKYYKSFIELNFFTNAEYRECFDGSLRVDDIKKKIQLINAGARFIDGNTLLFLDEIEFCPNARMALKFLAEDGRYDVIATGSHLSLMYNKVPSYPVGYERQINMYPLDFREFMWAKGYEDDIIENLYDDYINRKQMDRYVNDRFFALLKEYMVVGGMPEVVQHYINHIDIIKVNEIQGKIINNYLDDISKFATGVEKTKVKNCFLAISHQLDRDNKKWTYTLIDENGSGRKYENSLLWLQDAKIAYKCESIKRFEYPLDFYVDDSKFKIYMGDIGLLVYMYGFTMKKMIVDESLKGFVKGGIYESLVADMLIKNDVSLYYYKDSKNTQEIEFVISVGGDIIPIEVKSTNGHTISLNEVLKNDYIKYGYKLVTGNFGVVDKKIVLPLYMSLFIAWQAEKKIFVG